jgi:competence protein ComEC
MLKIIIWDVQHGSSSYIKTPSGKHIVIDLGTGSNKQTQFSPLLYLKRNYNVSKLDKVVITHPHTDHIDDIFNFDELSPEILHRPKHLKAEDIRGANQERDRNKVDKYLEISEKYSSPVLTEGDPDVAENNGGVNLYSFCPTGCDTSNINNHSIVTVIEYLGLKVLIPGDNQTESWEELLKRTDFVQAITGVNILVASHHGRENGYCNALFDHFTPELVIISDGKATTTNISSKYYEKAKGWIVNKRGGGQSEKRYCLTTRSDGCIDISIWQELGQLYMQVNID